MPGSIPEVGMLSALSRPSGPISDVASAPSTRPQEPFSGPSTRRILAYIELPILSAVEKARYVTDLSERPITYEEAFPEQEMQGIIGEREVNSELYYFVKLSDGLAFRVRTRLCASGYLHNRT